MAALIFTAPRGGLVILSITIPAARASAKETRSSALNVTAVVNLGPRL